MEIRPYQHEFVDAVFTSLVEVDRSLGVSPTGSGKTCMAGELIRRAGCPTLFLADAQELVKQAADKLGKWSGLTADVEMADSHATPGSPLVVATTQSIARRLDKYPVDAFGLIIVDEAHRNTLGAQSRKVLDYFATAQVVGITATPFRSDKRQLGSFYQKIAIDIPLVRLVREGWLSKIVIKSVPSGIDLANVRTIAGDFSDADLGAAVLPHLDALARILKEHAAGRRTVVFLPLIETSRQFVACCKQHGLRAVHVDGTDRGHLKTFVSGGADIICCAALLSTGWDEPSVDCVYILRPTKSFVLYSQMVGRGTRIHPGKENLLVLDPLFLSDSMGLVRPARLVAKDEEQAKRMEADLASGRPVDLFDSADKAEAGMLSDRHAGLIARLKECAKRKARTVDPVEFAGALGDDDLAMYEPQTDAEAAEITAAQAGVLERAGFEAESLKGKGHASRIIDRIFERRVAGLATPKQLKWLVKFRHPSPQMATFEEASAFLDLKFGVKKEPVNPQPAAA
jgi:superfamily II DNA or RNA helicase